MVYFEVKHVPGVNDSVTCQSLAKYCAPKLRSRLYVMAKTPFVKATYDAYHGRERGVRATNGAWRHALHPEGCPFNFEKLMKPLDSAKITGHELGS